MDDYPADLDLDAPVEVANWRPLVHWLLAVPHLMIASVLGQVGGVIGFVSWFIIVFTGRLPESLANFQCLVLRYTARAYSYALWLREPYPAFDFSMTPADPGGDPLRVDLAPRLEDRNRLTVGLRFIWIIPIAIYLAFVSLAAMVVAFAGFFAVLFTGRWPEGMRRFLVATGRLSIRVSAYGYLLVDDYPPFAVT
ncbi:MAG: DUF4389 domain-containing protein [Actinomycetota bacterium]